MDLTAESDEDLRSWSRVGDDEPGAQTVEQRVETEYAPSIVSDFSVILPTVTADESLAISSGYNTDLVVQSAWKSLPSHDVKLPWEQGFWDKFLDPNISAMYAFSRYETAFSFPC